MRKLVVLLVLVAALVCAVAYSGVLQVPVLSGLMGTDHARDLGEADADPAAYAALVKDLGLGFTSPGEHYTFSSVHTFAGSVALDATLSEGTVMAIREFNAPAPGIDDVHVRFHNGSLETSAMVDLAPYGYPLSGPVYARATVTVTGPRSISVSVSDLAFGNVPVPGDVAAQAETAINAYLATRLVGIDGLAIDSLAFTEGGVAFSGTVPQSYGAGVPKVGDLP